MKKLSCILLVDDDEPTNYYNKKVVEKADCTEKIQVCYSVDDAISFLTTYDENGDFPTPEIIFLDINMPGKDGWDFLHEYRTLKSSQQGDIVVVMLTTSLNPADEEKAFEEGAKEFARKPLTIEQVHEVIKKHLPEFAE